MWSHEQEEEAVIRTLCIKRWKLPETVTLSCSSLTAHICPPMDKKGNTYSSSFLLLTNIKTPFLCGVTEHLNHCLKRIYWPIQQRDGRVLERREEATQRQEEEEPLYPCSPETGCASAGGWSTSLEQIEVHETLRRRTYTWGSRFSPPAWPAGSGEALAAWRGCCRNATAAESASGDFHPRKKLHVGGHGLLSLSGCCGPFCWLCAHDAAEAGSGSCSAQGQDLPTSRGKK